MNGGKLTKVHRVKSVDEALEFERHGVDMIGVHVDGDADRRVFDDDRYVPCKLAKEIAARLKRSQLSIEFCCAELEPAHLLTAEAHNISLVHFDWIHHFNQRPSDDVFSTARALDLRLVHSGIKADHDDDPSWILLDYTNIDRTSLGLYEIQLCADIEYPWQAIQEAAEYPEALHMEDIDELASHEPIFISTDASFGNIGEICESFWHVRGLSFTLGHAHGVLSCHINTTDFATAREALRAISNVS